MGQATVRTSRKENQVRQDQQRLTAEFESRTQAGADASDKVLQLAEAIAAGVQKQMDYEKASFELPKDRFAHKGRLEDARMHEYDRELATRQLLSFEPAKSITGAAIQIAESLSALDLMWDQVPREAIGFETRQDYRRLTRLLFSVRDFLLAQTDLVPEHFKRMPGNPWVPVDVAAQDYQETERTIEADCLNVAKNKVNAN
ncbi:hypothetical protein [Agrobacterium sp. ST15.13.015]|uniref:hypothetical protein n=1 Tax=Agrobacterium sp. ST15.13.015 TaxID=3017319 RepID=UPI0022C8C5ED|nr:hypothetical protein [Agrobacterium sp. ST15.13.015]MCZ7498885.1 hypothetical protein [Rhizobium rhizogenes]